MRLLVAEPDASLAEFLRARFQQENFQVQQICTGKEFTALPSTPGFDVVLLDMKLPGIHCADAVPELQRRWPDVSLILLSSDSPAEDRARLLQAGADDVIVKPFAVTELVAKVHAILRRRLRAPHDVVKFEDLEVNRVSHACTATPSPTSWMSTSTISAKKLITAPNTPSSAPSAASVTKSAAITTPVDPFVRTAFCLPARRKRGGGPQPQPHLHAANESRSFPRAFRPSQTKNAPAVSSQGPLSNLFWNRFYFIPEPLIALADFALGSRLNIPSVADTATSEPSRRVRNTGK